MPRRRRSVFASPRPSYGRSAMWLEPGMRRRRGPRRVLAPLLAILALAAAIAAVVYVILGTRDNDPRPDANHSNRRLFTSWSVRRMKISQKRWPMTSAAV